jgi:hypothetical protein
MSCKLPSAPSVDLLTFAFTFLVLLSLCYMSSPLQAQSTTPVVSPANVDTLDAKAFAILFRRENSYLKIAAAAASPDKPEAHLDRVLPLQLEIDPADTANFAKFASDWGHDTQSLRANLLAAISRFQSSFPNGRVGPGVATTPPPELADWRAQIDAVTLRYRDKLHNTMREPDFIRLQTNVEKTFASSLQGQTPTSYSSPSVTGAKQ